MECDCEDTEAALMARIKIVNWDRWQSYRSDRGQPPWIKVHRNLMRNPDWLDLTDAQRGQLVSMWMLAADNDGVIVTPDRRQDDAKIENVTRYLRKVLYLSDDLDLQVFIDLKFIKNWRHNDDSAASTRRQHDAPEKRREEKSRVEESSNPSGYSRLSPDPNEVFTHWNSFDILTTHRAFTPKMAKSLNARVNGGGWTVSDICKAITRYAELCHAGTAYGYGKWGLDDLLSRKEGAYLDKMLNPNDQGVIHETADDRRRKHNAALLGTDSKVSLLDG